MVDQNLIGSFIRSMAGKDTDDLFKSYSQGLNDSYVEAWKFAIIETLKERDLCIAENGNLVGLEKVTMTTATGWMAIKWQKLWKASRRSVLVA